MSGDALKPLIFTLFNLIPGEMRTKIATAFAEVELEEVDTWLFPSPFTPEEEQWLFEQIEQLQMLGGLIDETAAE